MDENNIESTIVIIMAYFTFIISHFQAPILYIFIYLCKSAADNELFDKMGASVIKRREGELSVISNQFSVGGKETRWRSGWLIAMSGKIN
jgi:hypothetical protein